VFSAFRLGDLLVAKLEYSPEAQKPRSLDDGMSEIASQEIFETEHSGCIGPGSPGEAIVIKQRSQPPWKRSDSSRKLIT
jgi:hypothetical protein